MPPDDLPPRIPERRREVRSYSPGGSARPREAFQVRRSGLPGETRSRGVRKQARIVKLHHELWIGAVVLGLILVVVGGLWLAGRDRKEEPVAATTRKAEARPGEKMIWQGPVPPEVAENFTKATTHAERLRWVRHPDEVGPMMEQFFREGPGATERILQTIPIGARGSGDMLHETYHVVIEDGPPRLISVTVDPEGAKVDFKAYARHGSESWERLLSGEVASAEEMRVLLTPGGFYMHRFADESRWLHFEAKTPDLSEPMDFYVDRDSEAAAELGRIEGIPLQVTVSLRAVEDSARYRQFEITALKAEGWADPQP